MLTSRRLLLFGLLVGALLLAAMRSDPIRRSSSRPSTDANTSAAGEPLQPPAGTGFANAERTRNRAGPKGIHKIKHVVIIMQENRSFDNYFGTFPGADGIPRRHGVPTVCVPDPVTKRCVRPFLDNSPANYGGPHGLPAAIADINGGRMNGFIAQAALGRSRAQRIDVMGYHNGRSLHNYWSYAKHFVLNDHMFASTESWSMAEHLYMVSEWAARCGRTARPRSCVGTIRGFDLPPDWSVHYVSVIQHCTNSALYGSCDRLLSRFGMTPAHRNRLRAKLARSCDVNRSFRWYSDSYGPSSFKRCRRLIQHVRIPARLRRRLLKDVESLRPPDYAWTDLTYLMHKHHVKWRYYVMNGTEPDCESDSAVVCPAVSQDANTPGIWNPLPYFDTVRADHQLRNIRSLKSFYGAANAGKLPAVSWIVPTGKVSEHPPGSVAAGQAYVTGLINTIMRGPDWRSTAIFVSWDEWGGFYDHVRPRRVDRFGYGLRVPGLIISPYARRGYIDHQITSHDAYVKFIEDDFLGGARLDPRTDGRPDSRPSVREASRYLGDLRTDFNFKQKPRRPLILRGAVRFWHGPR